MRPGMLKHSEREIVAEAMRVMLLRHAKSKKAEGGMSDHARRLKGRGKSDAPVIGAYMARHELVPDLVLVSTAERARQTWKRLAAALPAPPRVVYEDHLYNAAADAIIALVKGTSPTVRTLLVVGHNPGLQDAARRLIASGDVETRKRLDEGLPTSGLAVIDFAGKDWRKRLVRSPRRSAGPATHLGAEAGVSRSHRIDHKISGPRQGRVFGPHSPPGPRSA
jgi:phosphohistidine phosphatase